MAVNASYIRVCMSCLCFCVSGGVGMCQIVTVFACVLGGLGLWCKVRVWGSATTSGEG